MYVNMETFQILIQLTPLSTLLPHTLTYRHLLNCKISQDIELFGLDLSFQCLL